ncbi:MAG: heavy metal translocating P-type ATPase metal-binding domain-containing protein [Opitutales bacterium]
MKRKCQHCGRGISGKSEEEFCCEGCARVHALIRSEGLEDYYALQDRAGRPLGEVPLEAADYDWARALQEEAEGEDAVTVELELGLDGMTCMGCLWLIERLGRQTEGLLRVKASLVGQRLRLVWRRGAFDLAGYLGLLRRFGYEARPRASGGRRLDGLAWRAVLTAVFTANLGLLALAERHLDAEFARSGLLDLLQVLFLVLTLVVGAGYFLVPVFRAARLGELHFDLFAGVGLSVGGLGVLGNELGAGVGPMGAPGFALAVTVLLLARRLQIEAVRRGGWGGRERPDRIRWYRRWMSGAYWMVLAALAFAFLWGIVEVGVSTAWSRVLAALFAVVLYPAELFIEEGRSAWAVGGATLLGLAGGGLALLGWMGPGPAVGWHALVGLALVFSMAKSGKAGDAA